MLPLRLSCLFLAQFSRVTTFTTLTQISCNTASLYHPHYNISMQVIPYVSHQTVVVSYFFTFSQDPMNEIYF